MASFSLSASVGIGDSLDSSSEITAQQQASYQSNGFLVNATPTASGNGLPYSQITPAVPAQITRNIITWFVPQFGTVQMFVNPNKIVYNHKKLIQKERTKGGFTLQYWGEELDVLDISGTTGSSGIEGINMLYEIYRAEQYAFDAVGLTLAANNASTDVSNNLSVGIGGAIGQTIGLTSLNSSPPTGLLGGILGLSSPNATLSCANIPSLASLAFAVEMYYNGWVYRGYFDSMNVSEQSDDFLLHYDMKFIATQRRGYRTNYFPWSNSPTSGSSQYSTPGSFSGDVVANTNTGVDNVLSNDTSLGGLLVSLL
jgi:hypothetical protein